VSIIPGGSMETIIAIALLCQINASATHQKDQKQCQTELSKCMEKITGKQYLRDANKLLECVKKRK